VYVSRFLPCYRVLSKRTQNPTKNNKINNVLQITSPRKRVCGRNCANIYVSRGFKLLPLTFEKYCPREECSMVCCIAGAVATVHWNYGLQERWRKIFGEALLNLQTNLRAHARHRGGLSCSQLAANHATPSSVPNWPKKPPVLQWP